MRSTTYSTTSTWHEIRGPHGERPSSAFLANAQREDVHGDAKRFSVRHV